MRIIVLSILVILLLAMPVFAETYEWKGTDDNDYKLVIQKQALLMSGPYTTSFYYDFNDDKKEEDILTDVRSKCEKAKADYNTLITNMKAEADRVGL